MKMIAKTIITNGNEKVLYLYYLNVIIFSYVFPVMCNKMLEPDQFSLPIVC